MDDMLKILHYVAIGIIIVKTIFVFAGHADIEVEIVEGEGECMGHDGQTSDNCTEETEDACNNADDGGRTTDEDAKKCKWVVGTPEDASPWERLTSILFAGDNITKWGKIFISLVTIGLILWNTTVSNSNWLFSVILFAYIVISYGGLQKTYSQKVGKYVKADRTTEHENRERGCNLVIPMNSYYSAKFLELRVGYIFLIMIASVVICYRNIKGGCWNKDMFNTVLSVLSPLLMIFGLIIVSYLVSPSTEPSTDTAVGGGAAMDYVLSFFRGTPVMDSAVTGTDVKYEDNWMKTIGFPTLSDRTGRSEATAVEIMNTTDDTDTPSGYIKNKDRLTRVKQRVYMKFIIVVAILGFLIYSSVSTEVKCGLDLNSVKTLLIKAPTYLIAIIVFSPFIIKNIIINETVIDYANVSYSKYEGTGSGGDLNVARKANFGEIGEQMLDDLSFECMIDKMGGLEIYTLLCLLCLLMYAAEGTGYKLNMVAACVVGAIFLGYAMDES